MGVQVRVRDDQGVEQALETFFAKQRRDRQRQWYKRRFGYHEKPSELRRKREKMQRLRRGEGDLSQPGALKLYIGERELSERTGPTLAAGK